MDKRIIGSVRIGSTVYREGQEEEFAGKATAEQIASLTERGVIEGFGKSPKQPVEEAEVTTAEMVVEDEPAPAAVEPKAKKKKSEK